LHMVQLMPLQPQPLPHLIQTGLPFWYRLTQVVLEKRPLNGCSSGSSRSWKLNKHNSRTFQEAWETRFQLSTETTDRFRSRWSDRVSSPRRSCRRSRCRRRRAGAASRRRWTTRTCIYLAHRWSPGSPARHSTDRLDSRRADHTPSTHTRTHARTQLAMDPRDAHLYLPGSPARHSTHRHNSHRADHTPSTTRR